MGLLGKGVLVNWGGIVKSKEQDYNSWHSLEHMPERINIKGFLRGSRAVAIKGTDENHKYFMMYEAEEKKVFESNEYLERLNNPTNWTKEILSYYLSPSRTICDVLKSKSVGFAGYIATIRFIDLIEKNILDSNLIEQQIKIITSMNGITGMHFLKGDKKFGQMKTEEKTFRSNQGKQDQVITFAILIEGLNFKCLTEAIKKIKVILNLIESDFLIINYYQTQHILTKNDLNFT